MARSLGHPIPAYLAPSKFSPQGTHESCTDVRLSDGAGGGLEDRGAGGGNELGGSVLGSGDDGLCASGEGGVDGLGGTGRGDDSDGGDGGGGGSNGDELSAFFDEIEPLPGDADYA